MDETELWNDVMWILMNLMKMNLQERSVLCSSQEINQGDVD